MLSLRLKTSAKRFERRGGLRQLSLKLQSGFRYSYFISQTKQMCEEEEKKITEEKATKTTSEQSKRLPHDKLNEYILPIAVICAIRERL